MYFKNGGFVDILHIFAATITFDEIFLIFHIRMLLIRKVFPSSCI